MPNSKTWLSWAGLLVLASASPAESQGPEVSKDGPGTSVSSSHSNPSPGVRAVASALPIRLDGRLDEEIWATASPATNFTQQRPDDGKPATQRTEVRVLFDNEAVYIGARMFDSLGAKGVRTRLVRRDQETESDWIELVFDTHHDHIGRTSFMVNPSGVKRDAGVAARYVDESWDAVWEVETAIDSLGWVAEFKIPFSQLRFSSEPEQTWGLQITRIASRLNEMSMWSYWGIQEAGGPSRFGHLEGIQMGGGRRRAEVLPYTVVRYDAPAPGTPGDPFYDAGSGKVRLGGDVRYLATNAIVLDATINPDFGQVEADPAVVNLSAFETFFPERRPFFVSGGGVFGFGGFNCYFCSNVSSLSLFYSRRIGRAPQGDLPEGTEYADVPSETNILGAVKVTGRSRRGWTVGVLNALTGSETAGIQISGQPGTQQVEPLTNYFVGRLKRDLRNGNTTVGGMVTSVWRDLDDPLLRNKLSVHAEAVGLDWNMRWKNQTYSFMGNLAGSNVAGDSSAILRLQQSSARYFQRPDRGQGDNGAFSDRYDPAATRLGGYGLYSRIGKDAGKWLWEAMVNLRSPGFEVNDVAFLTRADYLWGNVNVRREFATPTRWYRSASLLAGGQQQINFDGDVTERQLHGFGRIEFLNYWALGGFTIYRPEVADDRALRGGPVVGRPSNLFASMFINSDGRKTVGFEAQFGTGRNAEGAQGYEASAGITWRPASNLAVILQPSFGRFASSQQFVTSFDDPTATLFYGRRYVMSDLQQDDLAMNTRVNVTFTPELSLEVFLQPLLSSINYSSFKEFDAPRTRAKSVYGTDIGTIAEVHDEQGVLTAYDIDPDGAGEAAQFRLDNPDFSAQSLRGNAVMRWEFRPGSTIYLVWTQSRDGYQAYQEGTGFGSSAHALGDAPPTNILMVKFSYWMSF